MISEQERRWGDFQGGEPILLPDGQEWAFYCPEARMRSRTPGWTFGPDVPPDVDAILSDRLGRILRKMSQAESEQDRASVVIEAAWLLLARNYRITQDEFESILSGASGWTEAAQTELGSQLQGLVGLACARSVALAEVT